MKNLFIMAAVAATFASCSTNNEDFVTMNEVQKITFDAPVMNKNGRAAITATKYPDTEKFKVFAQRTTGEYQTGWTNNFMDGVEVSKVQSENYWAPAADYFWPKNGDVISFAAYSPSSLVNGAGCTSVAYGATGLKVTEYLLDATLSKQNDLMYAPRVLNQTKNTATGVGIQFKHALSLINFTVKSDNTGITVTDIIVNNAKDKGTFSETIADGSSYSSTPAWSDQALQNESSRFEVLTGEQVITANQAAQALGDNLLMIPQTIESSTPTPQTLTVKWKYTNGGSIEVLDEITKNFSDLSITKWEIGKKYTYNITINLDKIYFNPSVENWTEGSNVEVKP